MTPAQNRDKIKIRSDPRAGDPLATRLAVILDKTDQATSSQAPPRWTRITR